MSDLPKNIIVLGNGFDLNLGLKTGYCDFLKSDQFILQKAAGSQLAIHLSEQHDLYNWIDIENELKECSRQQFENLEAEYDGLCEALTEYLESISYPEERWVTSQAFDLLEKYAKSDILIIDFNYTPTSRMLLRHFGRSDEEIDTMLIKIHGSTTNRDIIFGVEDGADIKRDHVFLKKSYNINFKPINFKDLFKNANTITIFGHSLGNTDFMYFRGFFNDASIGITKPKLMIFYHGKKGYKQLFIQLDIMTNQCLSALKQHNDIRFVNSCTEETTEASA